MCYVFYFLLEVNGVVGCVCVFVEGCSSIEDGDVNIFYFVSI